MATKQLDALIRNGLIGTLKYEIDLLAGPLENQKQRDELLKAGQLQEVRDLINLAFKAQCSHMTKAEKARFRISS